MNIFTRLGLWWDRVYVDTISFDRAFNALSDGLRFHSDHLVKHDGQIETLENKLSDDHKSVLEIEKNFMNRFDVLEAEKQVPSTTLKEFNMLKVRLERIELLVGLKRDPVVSQLPDAPRIS